MIKDRETESHQFLEQINNNQTTFTRSAGKGDEINPYQRSDIQPDDNDNRKHRDEEGETLLFFTRYF